MFNMKVAPACPLVQLARPTRNELAVVATAARMFPCGLKRTTSLHPVDIVTAPRTPHRPMKVSVRAARSPPNFQADELSGTTPEMKWETVKLDSVPPQHAPAFRKAVKQGLIQIVVTEAGEYLLKIAKDDKLVPTLEEFFSNLPEKAEEGWHKIEEFFVDDIAKPVEEGWNKFEEVIEKAADRVAEAADRVANAVKGVWNKIFS